jgi:Tol biopolymer transport system component
LKRVVTLGVGLAVLATGFAVVSSSHATFRGKKGAIAFRRYFDSAHTWGAVFTINPDGTGERQVTHPPKGTVDDQPDWAPDGSSIVFERCPKKGSCRVYAVNPDGSGLTKLLPVCSHGATCGGDGPAAFAPDGRHLIFGRFDSGYGCCAIVVTDVRGKNLHVVTKGKKPYTVGEPQLSPDGTRVAFIEATQPADHPRAIFVVNTDGSGLHRVTPWNLNGGDAPDWSPDGKWILFHSNVDIDGKQPQVYLVHPDGTGLKKLTAFKPGTIVSSSSFSPDGTSIVLASTGEGGHADIAIIPSRGGALTWVTRTPLWDSAPDWGPAG